MIAYRKGILGIFLLVGFFFLLFLMVASYLVIHGGRSASNLRSESTKSMLSGGSKEDGIGVIEVTGVILDSKKTVEALLQAEEDESLKAIIVRIDTPGGAVAPVQEIYEEIRRIDEKKPIYASFATVAASGGYYIGAATRRIYSNPGTLTGSIGVIMQFMDLSKLYEFAKMNSETIKAGKYKDMGNPSRAMTNEERAILGEMVTNVHQQFMDDIMKRRKSVIKGDITTHAQGQIFSGKRAKELGLVDELGSLWSAGRAIHRELKLKGKLNLVEVKIRDRKIDFWEFIQDIEETSSSIKDFFIKSDAPLMLYRGLK